MKFEPRHNQIIGRLVIKRSSSSIIRPDETKVTKFILVDAVGTEAEAKGIKVGDLVLPKRVSNILLDSGAIFRPTLEEPDIIFFVRDIKQEQLLVQVNAGTSFVAFSSPEAAESLGALLEQSEAA